MKLNRKILAVTTGAVLLAGGLSAAALAGPGGHGRFAHRGGRMGMMGAMPGLRLLHLAETLNLSDEQELAAIKMRREIREEAQQNRQQMASIFSDVLIELEKPEPDAARLHQIVDQTSARMTKLAHASVDKYLKFQRTLTPEQRQQLVDHARMMKERREQFRKSGFQK